MALHLSGRAVLRNLFPIVILLYTLTVAAAPTEPLSAFGRDAGLLTSPDSRTFISSLQSRNWPFATIDKANIAGGMELFSHRVQSDKLNKDLTLSWSIYETGKTPIFLSFPGADDYFDREVRHPVFLATLQSSSGAMKAFFAVTLLKNKAGSQEGIIEYIMSPNGDGLAEEILLFLKHEFSSLFHLTKLYAELEWAGREYWARPQFGFALSDLQPIVLVNDSQTTFRELVRQNFGRFLQDHAISPQDLWMTKEGQEIEFDWSKLQSPADLLTIRAKNKKKIVVEALKAHNRIQRRLLNVGPAFLLASHQEKTGQSVRISVGGKAYSDSAMPPWFGVLESGCQKALSSRLSDESK